MSYLWDTAPFCGSAPCYVHGRAWSEAEHHVRECFASQTLAGQVHLMNHEIRGVMTALGAAELESTQALRDFAALWYEQLPWFVKARIELTAAIRRWFPRNS